MNSEVKIDILFAGLLLIPILILAIPYLKNKLVLLSRGKAFSIISLPISAYLIYDISIESNVFGLIGLCVAYIVFFFYLCRFDITIGCFNKKRKLGVIKYIKALKRTKNSWLFTPSSLILANYFLPLSEALNFLRRLSKWLT